MAVALSVIVPVYNGAEQLGECLAALTAQAAPDTEILVVDDASIDDAAAVATKFGARVLRLANNSGPAAARNHGAAEARGAILVFVDADVVVARGAVATIRRLFAERPDVAAVFGSYDDAPAATGYVSRYRNLLHHFVHQRGAVDAATFWAGCGAVRRDVFHAVEGFDARRFSRPSIEDIDLGYRLRRAGHTILLAKGVQGTHLKRWTFASMIRTDIMQRALPWSRLTHELRTTPNTLNLKWDQRVSAVLAATAVATAALSAIGPEFALTAVVSLGGVLAINQTLYRFFFRRGGLTFAIVAIGLHLLYFLYSGLTYVFAWLEHRLAGGWAADSQSFTARSSRGGRARRWWTTGPS